MLARIDARRATAPVVPPFVCPQSCGRVRRRHAALLATLLLTPAAITLGVVPLAWAVVCANGGAGTKPVAGTDAGIEGNTACGENADASSDNPGVKQNEGGNTAFGRSADASGSDRTGQGGSNTAVGNDANAKGDNGENSAFGAHADASGDESFNTAIGSKADASGFDSENFAQGNISNATGTKSANFASGKAADAHGDHSFNTATGKQAKAGGDRSSNVATGLDADASGADSTNVAIGTGAIANGDGSANVAIGTGAHASGTSSLAFGQGAVSSGGVAVGSNAHAANGGAAFGDGAQATGANSAAFGPGAVATQDNQVVLGTSNHTYTTPGITSAESKARQSGPVEVVTSDANGNLATDGGQLSARLDSVARRSDENESGVALAMAIQNPDLVGTERFGLTANVGSFQGANALGFGVMGVVATDLIAQGDRAAIAGGVGVGFANGNGDSVVGGRVGFQWTR